MQGLSRINPFASHEILRCAGRYPFERGRSNIHELK
jgi:hypothetical protein